MSAIILQMRAMELLLHYNTAKPMKISPKGVLSLNTISTLLQMTEILNTMAICLINEGIDNIMFYVYPLFDELVTRGNLK